MGDTTRVIKKPRIIRNEYNETLKENWNAYSELSTLPKDTISIYSHYYESSYETYRATFEQILSMDDAKLLSKVNGIKNLLKKFMNERHVFKHLFPEMQQIMVKLFNIESFPVEKIITFLIDLNFVTKEGIEYQIFSGDTTAFITENCDKLESLNVLRHISINTRW